MKKPIRLYWKENYSEKPKLVEDIIHKSFNEAAKSIALYPGDLYDEVVNLIAEDYRFRGNQVLLGHGVEGLVNLICSTYLDKRKTGVMFYPSFFVFENNLNRYTNIKIPCRYDEAADIELVLEELDGTDLFIIASPNTETGNYLLKKDEIEKILKGYSGIVVVDECYYGIGNMTMVDLIDKHENLIVLKSITKVQGLGALRLGYALSNKKVIEKLNYEFREIEYDPINSFSLLLYKKLHKHLDSLMDETIKFKKDFYKLVEKTFPKDRVFETETNFVFLDISRYKIKQYKIINGMREKGYLMKMSEIRSDEDLYFPEIMTLTPPPKEYWEEFLLILKEYLSN